MTAKKTAKKTEAAATWIQIPQSKVPAGLYWAEPNPNRGTIVTRIYGDTYIREACSLDPYMAIVDASEPSDRNTTYYVRSDARLPFHKRARSCRIAD